MIFHLVENGNKKMYFEDILNYILRENKSLTQSLAENVSEKEKKKVRSNFERC